MIREVSVQNFKSIENLKVSLGRVTVLIGANGSGKSNLLEAIAMLGAAAVDKLDSEFLISRGIRASSGQSMVAAFNEKRHASRFIDLGLKASDGLPSLDLRLVPSDNGKWQTKLKAPLLSVGLDNVTVAIDKVTETASDNIKPQEVRNATELANLLRVKPAKMESAALLQLEASTTNIPSPATIARAKKIVLARINVAMEAAQRTYLAEKMKVDRFIIYAPENTALRRFEDEGQLQPVGIRGEGLFKLLQSFSKEPGAARLAELKRSLELIGWFQDFSIPDDLAPGENKMRVIDRFLSPHTTLDQRSANEGFLFLLFYFSVFLGENTPPFFAIDNIDAALNPKLCAELMRRLCILAKTHNKQVILTTHNPSILDGLNLNDDEHRLYMVYRNEEGRTGMRPILAPKPLPGEAPMKLSRAFTDGLIGGLPKNF